MVKQYRSQKATANLRRPVVAVWAAQVLVLVEAAVLVVEVPEVVPDKDPGLDLERDPERDLGKDQVLRPGLLKSPMSYPRRT